MLEHLFLFISIWLPIKTMPFHDIPKIERSNIKLTEVGEEEVRTKRIDEKKNTEFEFNLIRLPYTSTVLKANANESRFASATFNGIGVTLSTKIDLTHWAQQAHLKYPSKKKITVRFDDTEAQLDSVENSHDSSDIPLLHSETV